MASLDFIYDISEALRSQNINYIIITLQEFKEGHKVDAFIDVKDDEAMAKIQSGLVEAMKNVKTKDTPKPPIDKPTKKK